MPVTAGQLPNHTPLPVFGLESMAPVSFTIAPEGSDATADYYTDGDNDQVQIQAAIDAANTAGGGIVFLKAGVYTIEESIIMKSYVVLRGEGYSSVLYGSGTQFSVIEGHGSVGTPIVNMEMSDLRIDGTGLVDASYSTDTKGVYMTFIRKSKFKNLYIYNTPATGLGIDFLVETLIHGVIVDTAGRQFNGSIGSNGIGIGTGRWEDETFIISDCHAINCGNNGIMIEHQANGSVGQSNNCMIVNCVSDNNRIGYRNSGVGRALFKNCIAVNNTNDGIYMSSHSSQYSTETIVEGCLFTFNGADGLQVADLNAAESKFIVSNCLVANNTNNGIKLRNNTHIISNNIIHSQGRNGIHWFGDTGTVKDAIISGNHIFNNGGASTAGQTYGIYVQSNGSGDKFDGILIHGNRIYDDQGDQTQTHAIRLNATDPADIDHVNIINNDLRGNATAVFNNSDVTNLIVRDNIGYVTENSGTATVANGATTVVVTHGLSVTPTADDIMVTPTNSMGNATKYYIGTFTSTQFTITVDQDPGAATATFAWKAIVL